MGRTEGVVNELHTGEKPLKQYPHQIPFAYRQQVEQKIQKMLSQGVIQPSHSPCASPIVLVAKKEGVLVFVSSIGC